LQLSCSSAFNSTHSLAAVDSTDFVASVLSAMTYLRFASSGERVTLVHDLPATGSLATTCST